jgi:hypothetical protein
MDNKVKFVVSLSDRVIYLLVGLLLKIVVVFVYVASK